MAPSAASTLPWLPGSAFSWNHGCPVQAASKERALGAFLHLSHPQGGQEEEEERLLRQPRAGEERGGRPCWPTGTPQPLSKVSRPSSQSPLHTGQLPSMEIHSEDTGAGAEPA